MLRPLEKWTEEKGTDESLDFEPGLWPCPCKLYFLHRPNVCKEEQLVVVRLSRPCTRAFIDTVKFWKQGCTGPRWCVAYERRTRYYTVYRQVYTTEHQTVFRCCPGWSRWDDEPGCLSLEGSAWTGMINSASAHKGFRDPTVNTGIFYLSMDLDIKALEERC
ncbi:hypothetical protein ACRRTK_010282 [Alexandromys fortis]